MNDEGSGREAFDAAPLPHRPFPRLIIAILFAFWLAQYSTLTTMLMLRSPEDALNYLLPRALVTVFGILYSFGALAIQWWTKGAPLRRRSLVAVLLAVVGAALHGIVNEFVFVAMLDSHASVTEMAWSALSVFWIYMSMSLIVLALTYAIDLREREQRIAALRGFAQAAQLRALRFQLNPHFLFNALNSIASLVSRNRNQEAETMTECLSDFLRSTMRMDPEGEIRLSEEIALQSLYLEIEKARFPDRLVVELSIPDELKAAAVPNLITQPLVENAVKYAVARSAAPVTLRISATCQEEHLIVRVADDGGDAQPPTSKGTHIGLNNVSERLRLLFGIDAALTAGPIRPRGFEAAIRLPLRLLE